MACYIIVKVVYSFSGIIFQLVVKSLIGIRKIIVTLQKIATITFFNTGCLMSIIYFRLPIYARWEGGTSKTYGRVQGGGRGPKIDQIHQFDIGGLSFAMGSGRELGVKEICQLYVYNSIVRVKHSLVIEIWQKFRSFFKFYYLCVIWYQETAFFKSSCICFASTDYRHSCICFMQRSGCWPLPVLCIYHRQYGLRYDWSNFTETFSDVTREFDTGNSSRQSFRLGFVADLSCPRFSVG